MVAVFVITIYCKLTFQEKKNNNCTPNGKRETDDIDKRRYFVLQDVSVRDPEIIF